MAELENVLAGIGVAGAVDILLMAILIYGALAWMRARHMRRLVRGVLVVLAVYLVARLFELELTATALEAVLLVVLVAAIVLYGAEIRRLVERLNPFGRRSAATKFDDVDAIADLLFDLGRRRVGALVVFAGRDELVGIVEGGVELDGKWSEPLLRSIFDAGSMGHDGAVVILDGRIWRFACHLPLATDHEALSNHHGTRHSAALGMSQQSDALCIAVSEERGTVTVCERGDLHVVDAASGLATRIRQFVEEHGQGDGSSALRRVQPATAFGALVVAMLSWLIIVYGSRPMERTYTAKVEVSALSPSLQVQAVHPEHVVVRARGAGRDFVMARGRKAKVTLTLAGAKAGQQAITLTSSEVKLPRGLSLEAVEPSRISVSIVPR